MLLLSFDKLTFLILHMTIESGDNELDSSSDDIITTHIACTFHFLSYGYNRQYQIQPSNKAKKLALSFGNDSPFIPLN